MMLTRRSGPCWLPQVPSLENNNTTRASYNLGVAASLLKPVSSDLHPVLLFCSPLSHQRIPTSSYSEDPHTLAWSDLASQPNHQTFSLKHFRIQQLTTPTVISHPDPGNSLLTSLLLSTLTLYLICHTSIEEIIAQCKLLCHSWNLWWTPPQLARSWHCLMEATPFGFIFLFVTLSSLSVNPNSLSFWALHRLFLVFPTLIF